MRVLSEMLAGVSFEKGLVSKKHRYYGAVNKDLRVRERSSSGGVFSLLADYVLNKSGSVLQQVMIRR